MMPDQFEFRGASMADLVGQPMVAIIKANQMMANEQVKLLMKICFSKIGDTYEPVMITMSIRRAGIKFDQDDQLASINDVVANFQVPLITLLPINSLLIEDVDIKFGIDVYTQHEVFDDEDNLLFGKISSAQAKSYELGGSIKYEPRDKAENGENGGTSSLSISASAHVLPLPVGVTTLIQAYANSIHPSDTSQKQTNDQEL